MNCFFVELITEDDINLVVSLLVVFQCGTQLNEMKQTPKDIRIIEYDFTKNRLRLFK